MRIGIANDLTVAAEALRRIVLSNNDYQVAWTARDGDEAIRLCESDTPDAVLMDLVMPKVNGADATREIMRRCPCAVLVVTATVSGNFQLVCSALSNGAFDAVVTPTLGNLSPAQAGTELLSKLARVEQVNRQLRSGSRVAAPLPSVASASLAGPAVKTREPIVLVGSSTGGPAALEAIFTKWPASFPAGVVVAQHVGVEFVPPLAQWLADRCKLRVHPAVAGEPITAGTVLLAATNDHIVLRPDRTVNYTRHPADCPYRPSVDALFESAVDAQLTPGVAVLLTGIGSDGARGLRRLRDAGWCTVAQDESTSVVYGMPQAAARLNAATRILPLPEIAAFIENHLKRKL